jgi:hypothetical protein
MNPSEIEQTTTLCQQLFQDDYFAFCIQRRLKTIFQDGKLDEKDVPEIIGLIMDVLNAQPKLKVTADSLPTLVAVIFRYVWQGYKDNDKDKDKDKENHAEPQTAEQEQYQRIEGMIMASMKLVMMQPKIIAATNSCVSKLNAWFCACW